MTQVNIYMSLQRMLLSLLPQLDIHMDAGYCTWFRYMNILANTRTEIEMTGSSIPAGRKSAAGNHF